MATKNMALRILDGFSKQGSFSYYEYKYLVTHSNLNHVRDLMETFCGGSDVYKKCLINVLMVSLKNASLESEAMVMALFARCIKR